MKQQYSLFSMTKSGWHRVQTNNDFNFLLKSARATKRPFQIRTHMNISKGVCLVDRGWKNE